MVAAMRSPTGASAALLRAARSQRISLAATASLCIEYEAVCCRNEHKIAAGFGDSEVSAFLDAVIALMEPVGLWFLWRPQLPDPGDELVLEAAVNGGADAIVTFNRRHFSSAAARFGIDVLLPSEAMRRIM